MSEQQVPRIALNDGTTIPQLGFGTFLVPPDTNPTEENTKRTAEVVGQALEVGYRLVDTAQMYGNELGVGRALAASGIPRDELYVTSKLNNGNHRPDDVRRTFDESMEKLGLEWLDLFLVHWPLPTLYDGDLVSTWKAMAQLLEDGRLRSVGVSNFQPAHLDRILGETGVVPAVNQIELHPYFANTAAVEGCLRHGVAVESWGPLGQGHLLEDKGILEIAADVQRSPAQVMLRWHLQHGYIVIPKTAHRERMEENFRVFDFELPEGEMARVDALDQGEDGRIGPNPDTMDWIP